MCAAISLFSLNQSYLDKPQNEEIQLNSNTSIGTLNKPFCRILTQYQQAVWLRGYRQIQWLQKEVKKHLSSLLGASEDVVCLALASRLSLMMHGTTQIKKMSFQSALSYLVQHSPSTATKLLEPLMVFPSVTPPGAYVMLDDGSLGIVTGIFDSGVACFPESTARQKSAYTSHFIVSLSRVKQVYCAQKFKQFNKLNNLWGDNWQEFKRENQLKTVSAFTPSYKMSRPPATLIAIQEQLNKPVQDIKALSKAIAREPAFAQHLQRTASQSSRQKLPMKDIQHGLMMHGLERSGSIIMQQALLSRLNQHYFPLQKYFVNFAQLRGHIAASLAKVADIGIPEQACTLSHFACVGLFTHPQLKIQLKWQRPTSCFYDMRSLISCVNSEQLRSHSLSLAEAWHQPRHEIVALSNYHELHYLKSQKQTVSVKLAALLGISLIISRELYFVESQRCVQTLAYWQSASKVLGVSEQELKLIAQDAFSVCHTFSPV
nr:histidine kinase [Paraglaciecola sp. 20A4]